MGKNVAIGVQDFETLIQNDYFYVDKTHFIKEWSLKCCYILKSTLTQACLFGNSLNSPRNFDSIRENFSISRTVHLLLLRPIGN